MPRIRARFRLWMVMALVAVVAIALSLPGSRRWMQRIWERRRDSAVLMAVMEDLLDPKNPEYANFVRNRGAASEIVLSDRTVSREWIAFTFPDGSEAQGGDQADRLLRSDLFADLVRRNGDPVPMSDFGWRDSRIIVTDLDREMSDSSGGLFGAMEFWERHPKSWGHVAVSMPGYSTDGETAIVVADGGPSPHGEWWVFLVKRTGGRWRVVDRTLDFSG